MIHTDPVAAIVARLDARGYQPKPSGPDAWEARCPSHNGSRRNLSIKRGDDGRALVHCHHNGTCNVDAILNALDMTRADLFPPRADRAPTPPGRKARPELRRHPTPEAAIAGIVRKLGLPTASWTFHHADGAESFRVYRFDPPDGRKAYRPVHPTPEGWALGDPPGPLPLYRLPDLAGAGRVYVTEGEKAASRARELGVTATTSPHGAKSPHKTDWTPLAGRYVVILPDHDPEGDGYASAVMAELAKLSPRPSVKLVRLPELRRTAATIPEGADLDEWLRDGVPDLWEPEQCRAELDRLADLAPVADLPSTPPAEARADDEPVGAVASWPAPPAPPAFAGPAGEIVRAIEPHSEADPVANLVQLLVGFGNLVGRFAYFAVEADFHYANEYVALVGETSRGGKGTSLGHARRILDSIDPDWASGRMLGGLSSGEGLIHAVRDRVTRQEPVREGKRIVRYEEVETDAGESDKRLLCIESEMGGTRRVATRDGNTLSALVRQAWDSGKLGTLTRKDPLRATGAHVSIIGHITRDELSRLLTRVDAANGFANRFLWIAVRRSKSLPFGGRLEIESLSGMVGRLRDSAESARSLGRIVRDGQADEMWADAYERLSAGRPGLLGAVASRAAAHTMRLALIYALIDGSPVVRADHLRSALALWDYAERSAAYIFGDSLGEPDADRLLDALRSADEGLTRNEIRERVFGKNKSSEAVARLLTLLSGSGLAHRQIEATGGRNAERWLAGNAPTR